MKTKLKTTLALLAAFCGLQLFTATTAQAATPSGTKVVDYSSKTLPQWTTEDSGIYDYTCGAFNEGGTLEMSFTLNWNGETASGNQCIFHAGKDGTGFSIYQTTTSVLIFSIKNETGTAYQISGNLVSGNNTVVCRFEGTGSGTAKASVTLNGTRYDLGSWTLASMSWDSDAGERNKYSMGCRAPGWGNNDKLTKSTIANNTITATYTVEQPSEKYHNQLAGDASVPATTYGSITVPGNGYKATALTGKTEIGTSGAGIGGNFDGMFGGSCYINSHTVSGWFKVDALPSSGSYKLLWSMRNEKTNLAGYAVVVGSDGKVYFDRTTDDNSPTPTLQGTSYKTANAVITEGVWCYLAISIEKTGSQSGTVKLYKNGGAAETLTTALDVRLNGSTTINKFYIGGSGVSVAGFYIDNRVLTQQATIQALATDEDYVVPIVTGAARIGSTGYETVAAAFAAVQDGQTVVLLQACSETLTAPAKTFTLDLGGFAMSGSLATVENGSITLAYSGDTFTSLVTGGGTIVMPNNTLPTGDFKTSLAAAANWTGTLWIKNKTAWDAWDLESYGNANSKIKLTGVTGYAPSSSKTCTAEIVLEDDGTTPALTIANGWSKTTYTYTIAKLSGSGTWTRSTTAAQNYNISDISGFTGAFALSDGGPVINIGTSTHYTEAGAGGIIYIDSGYAATIASGKAWTVKNGIFINGTLTNSGTITGTVKGSGTLVYSGVSSAPTALTGLTVSDWTGTVWFKNANIGGWDFSNYCNDASKVKFTGVKGWLKNDVVEGVCPQGIAELVLENDGDTLAFELTASSEDRVYAFTKFTGSGTFKCATSASTSCAVAVADVSDFTGKLISAAGTSANPRPIIVGATGSAGSSSLISVTDGKTIQSGRGWEAAAVEFGATLTVKGNVDDIVVSGITTAPTLNTEVTLLDPSTGETVPGLYALSYADGAVKVVVAHPPLLEDRVALWNLDLQNDSVKGAYTMSAGSETTITNGTITTAKTTSGGGAHNYNGVKVDWTGFEGKDMTVLVKYSGFSMNNGRTALLSAIWGDSASASETTVFQTYDFKVGVGKNVTVSSWAQVGVSSAVQKVPDSGLMLITMSKTNNKTIASFSTRNDSTYGEFVEGYSVDYSVDATFYGIKIGGTSGVGSEFFRPQMTVEGVVVFEGAYTKDSASLNVFLAAFNTTAASYTSEITGNVNFSEISNWDPEMAEVNIQKVDSFTFDNTATDATVTFDHNVMASGLAVTSEAGNDLTIVPADGKSATFSGPFDFSGASGKVTLGIGTGTGAVTAGADTVLTGAMGNGNVTVASGKTITLPGGWTTPANVTGAGDVKIAGAEKTTAITWGANGITGKNILVSGTWAITESGQYIAKPFWIRGENAVFKISGTTDILYNAGDKTSPNPIYVEDGGEFQVYDRDTCKRAITLSNGGKMTFDGDDGGSGRAFDFYTDSSLTVNGTTPCVIGGLTAGSTTASGIIAIRRSDFTVTVNGGAELQCYSAWKKEDNGGGNFIKAGNGKMVQYRDSTTALPFVVNGGTLKFVNGGRTTTAGITLNSGCKLELSATDSGSYTLGNAISGAGHIEKLDSGTYTLTGANTYSGATLVSAGTLVANNPSASSEVTVAADATYKSEQDISAGGTFAKSTIKANNGSVAFKVLLNRTQIESGAAIALADLDSGITTTDNFTAILLNAETSHEVISTLTIVGNVLYVTPQAAKQTHEVTPTKSGGITWEAGQPLVSGGKNFNDYDNALFHTTSFTTDVTVAGTKLEASDVVVGGTYNFSGETPIIADTVCTEAGADATFANDVVATDVAITNGSVKFASLATDSVAVTNATFEAGVLGRAMKYVRLTITKVQEVSGHSGEKPAVAEFRLYRGNPTVGYTRLDWPVGTKISDNNFSDGSMGHVTTKETAGYPTPGGVGAGTGSSGGNEIQPGTLIDGYYYGVTTANPYEGSLGNNYNKWWPTTKTGQPWVVQIEFPYPVAIFAGCNFCLADVNYRNPVSWTIDVSLDGQNWVTVNKTTDATWTSQNAWRRPDDLPSGKAAEDWPAFVNNVDPTVVDVNNSTIVADGSWSADLRASGNLVFKGVAGKKLTLDVASRSAFDPAAHLKFDLNAYDVSAAGKQYVVAGPTEGWPDVEDITVEPSTFSLYKDAEGYYVVVESGNYWLGENAEGVGTWDFRTTRAWATNATEMTKKDIWLNDVPAIFGLSSATVTIDGEVDPTAIVITNDESAVTFSGDIDILATKPIQVVGTNDTLTVNTDEDFDMSGATFLVVDSGALTLGKTGTGAMTLPAAMNLKGGEVAVNAGLVKFASAPTVATKVAVNSNGIFDLVGQVCYNYTALTLGGGTLTNSVNTAAYVNTLALTDNSTIACVNKIAIQKSGYVETTLELGEHTLTKTGSGEFQLVRTTVSGAGMIDVKDGTLYCSEPTTFGADVTLKVGATATIHNRSGMAWTLSKITGEGGTLNNEGTMSDFTLTGALKLANAGTYGTITLSSATLDIGQKTGLTLGGTGSVKAKLSAAYNPGDVVTLFTAASGANITLAEFKDMNGATVPTEYYTYADGVVTFKKEATDGTQYYFTLKQAIETQSAGTAIEMVADVTDTQTINVAKAISFDGGTNILSNVSFTFDGGTLTLNTGCIGIGYTSGMSLAGGCCRFNSTTQSDWSSHGPSGYSMQQLSAAVRGYQYEFVKSGFEPESGKSVIPVADQNGDAGVIKLDSTWVQTATGSSDPQVQAQKLNTPQNNKLMTWQNKILGLDGSKAESKPVVHFSQSQSSSEKGTIAFTLDGVDATSGATVKFKVYSADTPGASAEWKAASEETASGSSAEVALPTSGVKYYKYDVITETSK